MENNKEHNHNHSHKNTKAVINRLSRAIGHLESVKRMVIQVSAVKSSINNIGKIILQDHIEHCIVDAVETGDDKVLQDLNSAIDKFIK